MRSPKQRSRSKQNRPRTLGNITNRVFDSSGPEGKVRGTPQQIIEKYQVLARDAQLSNDRVAAENFQQHAEHYTRLLAQATREMQAEADARRIAHEEQQRHRQQNEDRQPRQNGQNHQNGQSPRRHDGEDGGETRPNTEFGLVRGDADSDDTTLVDTPEARVHVNEGGDDRANATPRPDQRDTREPREPRNDGRSDNRGEGRKDPRPPRDGQPRRAPRPDAARSDAPDADAPVADKPAEGDAAPKPRRNTRKPRKPADDAAQTQDIADPMDPSRAAE